MGKRKVVTVGRFEGEKIARERKLRKYTPTLQTKNNGSALGYLGTKTVYGLAWMGERFSDWVRGNIYQLAGDKEYAQYLYDKDIVGEWTAKLDREYNPTGAMKVVGDVAFGVGQALPSVAVGIATGGTSAAAQVVGAVGQAAVTMAYMGGGVTDAVKTTGKLGAKENKYGIASGLLEGVTDKFFGGAQMAGKALVTAGKSATKVAAGKVARNTLMKHMLSAAGSEALEEFVQEYADAYLRRKTGVDKDAQTSLSDAMYSALIGGLTGGFLGGAAGSVNAAMNIRRGESVKARGLENSLLATANYIRKDYIGEKANFDNIQSASLRALSASIDAYDKLSDKSGTRASMLLGEIKMATLAFESEVGVRRVMNQMMQNPTEALAAHASTVMGRPVTVEELRNNVDGITEQFAVQSFATGALTESSTDRKVNAIKDRVVKERYMHVREGASFDGTLSAEGELVYRMNDGRYAIVTADQREGNEGKYRVGFSATPEFDPDNILINPGSATVEEVRTALTGLNDGSLVVGEKGLERAQTSKNAPASDGGAKIEQTPTEIANEAQRVDFDGESDTSNQSKRNALTSDYEKRIEAWDQKTEGFSFVLGNTSSAIQNIEVDGKPIGVKQVRIDATKIKKILSDHKEMTIEVIKQLPKVINDPMLILDSKTVDGRLVLLGEVYATNGQPVKVILELNPSTRSKKSNKVYANVTKIASAYGQGNLQNLINTSKIRYINKSRINDWLKVNRLQLPLPNSQSDPATNSISQNQQKSTPSGENVSENVSDNDSKRSALPKTREAKERKRKRAQEHQRQSREKRKAERMAEAMREEVVRNAEQNAEVNAEQGTEAPQETVEKAKIPARGYTDVEANDARALVKDFDLLPAESRRAIVELMRSGKASGASKNFLRHSANLIAYWRKGLWIIADDKTRDDGFYYVLDDGTRLITVNPKREAKAVSETLMHELAHDVWARADAKIRKALYGLATAGVDQKEIEEIRERYRTELTQRGELTKRDADGNTVDMTEAEVNALLDEEVATNLLGEAIGTEEFLSRFDGEGKFAAAKRIWRTLYNMKKRFTGKDKFLYRKADDLFKTFTKIMAVEEFDARSRSGRIRYDLNDTRDDGKSEAYFQSEYEKKVDDILNGTYQGEEIVLIGRTPIILTDIGLSQLPLTITASHIYSIAKTKAEAKQEGKYKKKLNYHGLGEKAVKQIREKIKEPIMVIAHQEFTQDQQTKHAQSHKITVVVELEVDGRQVICPIEVDTSIRYNKSNVDSNHVSTYFDKSSFDTLLKEAVAKENIGETGFYYLDEKKANSLLQAAGYQLPERLTSRLSASGYIIRHIDSNVNRKISHFTESEQFRRWFGNWQNNPKKASKVVNHDGTPMVLYHQTSEDIEVFDTRHKGAGTNDDETPFGIFLKPTDQDIGLKGKKQMALYARIVNPLVVANRYELVRQIKMMSPAYAELLKQRDALSVEYKQKIEDAAKKWSQYAKDYRDSHPDATRSAIYEDEEFRKLYDAEDELTEEWVQKADELALKCKEEITQTLKKNGYDGVHIKKDDGSGGRSVETYIAIEATQVKSATDNIGTFDAADPHIRHALPKKPKSQTTEKKARLTKEEKADEYKKVMDTIDEIEGGYHTRLDYQKISEALDRRAKEKAKAQAKAKTQRPPEDEITRENFEKAVVAERERLEREAAARIFAAEKGAENATKNAEKRLEAEKNRIEKEASVLFNRTSREISKLDKNLQYLKHMASHQKATDGSIAAAVLLNDPVLQKFVSFLGKRGSAWGVMHKSTREGVREFLSWYKEDNAVLNDETVDKLYDDMGLKSDAIFGHYSAEIRAKMERIANGEGNLTAAELSDLAEVVNSLGRLYMTYGKVKVGGRWVDAKELAREHYAERSEARRILVAGRDIDGKPGAIKKLWQVLGSVKEGYLYSVVTPEVVLKDLEGNVKGGVLSSLYREIRLGEAEAKKIRVEILKPVAEFFEEHKAYRKKLSTDRRFEVNGLKLTTAQAVGLWETSKREHAQQRLFDTENGGIYAAVPDEEGNITSRNTKVTRADVENLFHEFTEEDIAYINALEESFRIATKYKEQTDGEVWGYTNVIKGHYYPITTDENYFSRDITDARDAMRTIEVVNNKSFNKNTVDGAQAWLFIEDSLKVLERHSIGIGTYSGLYLPLKAFGQVYGAKFNKAGAPTDKGDADVLLMESVVGKTSLRQYYNAIWSKHGKSGGNLDQYLAKLFSDIQGITGEVSGIDRVVNKLQSGMVVSSFGLNAKVILTQLASYGAAYKNLDADVLVQAVTMPGEGEMMDKYSKLTLARDFDGVGAAEVLLDKISDFGRKTTKGIDFTDRQVILALYNACRLQVEKDGGGALGDEQNYKKAAEMLDNLLLDTQTTSLKSDASALMRDKSLVAKMFTMFRTESMKSFSNFYTSIAAYANHRQYAGAGLEGYAEMLDEDKKRISKTAGAFLLSTAWVSALSIAFSRIRKKARGEEEEEKLVKQAAKEITGNVVELFPIISDAYSFLADGYELEAIPISAMNDALTSLRGVSTLFDKNATDAEKNKYIRNSAYSVGSLVGIPNKNADRIGLAILTATNQSTAYLWNDRFKTAPTYEKDIEKALSSGNERLAGTILSAWWKNKKGGKSSDTVTQELLRLYTLKDGNGKEIFSMPKSVPSSLDQKTAAAFSSVYAGADAEVVSLIGSKAYAALDDAAKAKAVKACYDIHWSKAAQTVGLESTGSAARLASAEGVDPAILAAVTGYASAHTGENRKAHIIQYLISLGVSLKDRNKYLSALGYKVS